jgi:hypothetical protein
LPRQRAKLPSIFVALHYVSMFGSSAEFLLFFRVFGHGLNRWKRNFESHDWR